MEEWIVKQFLDQFRDFGMEKPWYWDQFIDELSWYHHAIHLGLWYWRPTLWWNPDAGVAPEERDWLETKYPGWNATFGKYWDTISENVRKGKREMTYPETFPVTCNLCQIPIATAAGYMAGHLQSPAPLMLDHNGRRYVFCSQPCKWIFEENIERFAGHQSIVDRLLTGQILPPTIPGALAYMGLSPAECGDDATNYAWATK
jgi:toluene monooxygenase system protein A